VFGLIISDIQWKSFNPAYLAILQNFGNKKSIVLLKGILLPFFFPQGGNDLKTPSPLGEGWDRGFC